MKRKIVISKEKLDSLVASLRGLPDKPVVGDHLSDDEFIGYTTGKLAGEELQKVDEHLESCCECCAEMERLLEARERLCRGSEVKKLNVGAR